VNFFRQFCSASIPDDDDDDDDDAFSITIVCAALFISALSLNYALMT